MRNLDYYLRLNSKSADKNTYLSLIQRNISGGRIKRQDIDIIQEFPNITEISISGLTQDTFNYFIENYGHQFKAILFWKCPLVGNLKLLESLDHVEYIVYFWNQRAEGLWDFSKTKALKGLVSMISPACTIFLNYPSQLLSRNYILATRYGQPMFSTHFIQSKNALH